MGTVMHMILDTSPSCFSHEFWKAGSGLGTRLHVWLNMCCYGIVFSVVSGEYMCIHVGHSWELRVTLVSTWHCHVLSIICAKSIYIIMLDSFLPLHTHTHTHFLSSYPRALLLSLSTRVNINSGATRFARQSSCVAMLFHPHPWWIETPPLPVVGPHPTQINSTVFSSRFWRSTIKNTRYYSRSAM